MARYSIHFVFWLFLTALPLLAQQQDERLRLVYTDELGSYTEGDELVRTFTGNVHFRQGEIELHCDKLFYYQQREQALLVGHIKIKDKDVNLVADSARYFIDKRQFNAFNNVELTSTDSRLISHSVTYFQKEKRAVAQVDVHIIDKKQNVDITGQFAELVRPRGYTKMTGEPVLIQYDSTGAEEMRIVGESMESFEKGKRFEIKENVKITRDITVATCGFASYFSDDEFIELRENPVAVHLEDKITGDVIKLQLANKKLQEIEVTGKAKFSSPPDSTIRDIADENYMTGQEIRLYFADDIVNKVQVNGMATSVYHVLNEDGVYQGRNWAQGDTITIFLEDKGISKILIKSDPGNSLGKFDPPETVQADKGKEK